MKKENSPKTPITTERRPIAMVRVGVALRGYPVRRSGLSTITRLLVNRYPLIWIGVVAAATFLTVQCFDRLMTALPL